jgi:hypothetical protein
LRFRERWAAAGVLFCSGFETAGPNIHSPILSIAQLADLSAKFKRILALSLPRSSHNFAAVNIEDYDFGSWLADVLPPMRPLVWSLVLKIFARFLEKGHCEREFDAALLTAHTLPIETLKQIEVNDAHILPVEQLKHDHHTHLFTFSLAPRLTSAAAMRWML